MFKNFVYNKIFKLISLLLILVIMLIFPISTRYELSDNNNKEIKKTKVFLLNNNDYISEVNISLDYNSYETKIKKIIELLVIDGIYADLIPNKYKAVFPSETKLLDIEIKNDTIILNFNDNFLGSSFNDLENNIKLLVHNCLIDNKYNKVYIEVESKLLTNYNNISFYQPFTRDMLINVINKTTDYKNIVKTKVFFYSKTNDIVPVTILSNQNKKKINVIIDELSNSNYNDLYSYMNYNVELIDYKIQDDVMSLFFDDKIYDNKNNRVILKPVYNLLETSIINNFPIKNIKIYVNNKEIKKSSTKNVE